MITLTTKLINLTSEVYYQALHVPAAEVKELLKEAGDKRVICRLETGFEWHCALMSLGDGDFYINVNQAIRAKNGLADDEENVVIQLRKDESEYGMPVPEELVELWAIYQEGWEVFNTLTP